MLTAQRRIKQAIDRIRARAQSYLDRHCDFRSPTGTDWWKVLQKDLGAYGMHLEIREVCENPGIEKRHSMGLTFPPPKAKRTIVVRRGLPDET